MMHGREKSGPVVVAGKRANKAERSAAEPVERRAGAEGNACQNRAHRAQNRRSASQALARIRQASKSVSPSHTRGGSRMRESRTYGSVRGALSNGRPYRDHSIAARRNALLFRMARTFARHCSRHAWTTRDRKQGRQRVECTVAGRPPCDPLLRHCVPCEP